MRPNERKKNGCNVQNKKKECSYGLRTCQWLSVCNRLVSREKLYVSFMLARYVSAVARAMWHFAIQLRKAKRERGEDR